jgi:hypothetical protein
LLLFSRAGRRECSGCLEEEEEQEEKEEEGSVLMRDCVVST